MDWTAGLEAMEGATLAWLLAELRLETSDRLGGGGLVCLRETDWWAGGRRGWERRGSGRVGLWEEEEDAVGGRGGLCDSIYGLCRPAWDRKLGGDLSSMCGYEERDMVILRKESRCGVEVTVLRCSKILCTENTLYCIWRWNAYELPHSTASSPGANLCRYSRFLRSCTCSLRLARPGSSIMVPMEVLRVGGTEYDPAAISLDQPERQDFWRSELSCWSTLCRLRGLARLGWYYRSVQLVQVRQTNHKLVC